MGTHLHEALRSLCYNTEWKYAVFWKLKHRARMMLTWEDAYYDNHGPLRPSEDMCVIDTHENLHDGHYLRDPVGLAVAKMSYLVYSLGEGIIGQVAVTGKHQWIFADNPAFNSLTSSEYCHGWQNQFSAGIRTIAVVAVIPHGVVQLGSLNMVSEDLKLVTHVRDLFCSLHNSIEFSPNLARCTLKSNSFPGGELEKISDSQILNDYVQKLDKVKKIVEVLNNRVGFGSVTLEGDTGARLIQPSSGIFNSECPKQVKRKLINNIKHGEETNCLRDMYAGSRHNDALASNGCLTENRRLNNVMFPVDNSRADYHFSPSDFLDFASWDRVKFDRVVCRPNKGLYELEPMEMQLEKCFEQNVDLQTIVSHMGTVNPSSKCCAGSELHEALWPVNKQQSCALSEAEKTEAGKLTETTEGMESSWVMPECGSENLLEAVVASAFHGAYNIRTEDSFCKSTESVIMSEKIPQPSSLDKLTCGSEGGPLGQSSLIEKDSPHFLSSTWGSTEACAIKSPKELSSTTLTTCSEQLDRQVEPSKMNRKRARPGESCRPRPRDRQLIQDRIKELRELVPNGSKCSIDALLERTIKHMLFLQSVKKHAKSMKKCDESELLDKGMGILGREKGSSWALEVGSQTKVCPIIVENLNRNGQMLVEMLCEDCSHFLEIAEAIRGLGMTILKGATQTRHERTWACFIVEGQSNEAVNRMDILWSLMHLLQLKQPI